MRTKVMTSEVMGRTNVKLNMLGLQNQSSFAYKPELSTTQREVEGGREKRAREIAATLAERSCVVIRSITDEKS